MNEWMSEWINEWMNEWKNEWMIEWINEWMNEWMIEWVSLFKVKGSLKSFARSINTFNKWITRKGMDQKKMNEWMNEWTNNIHHFLTRYDYGEREE